MCHRLEHRNVMAYYHMFNESHSFCKQAFTFHHVMILCSSFNACIVPSCTQGCLFFTDLSSSLSTKTLPNSDAINLLRNTSRSTFSKLNLLPSSCPPCLRVTVVLVVLVNPTDQTNIKTVSDRLTLAIASGGGFKYR